MADDATATIEKKVTVTDAGPCRKTIAIEIPADAVDGQIGDALDIFMNEAALPGFRKGRAPKALVEKRFGSTIRSEARQRIVAMAYEEAVEEHKLRVIGQPTADQIKDVEVEPGKPLSFELTVEVMPEFDLPSLDGIKVLKPAVEVTDEQVDSEIDKLRINEGDLEEREASEAGDYITGLGIMTGEDGTEFHNINGAVVQVPPADGDGSGMILGVKVDDFATQLGTPKPGDKVTITATGPEGHEDERVRGQKLTVSFEVQRVDRIIPIEMAQVLERYGFESEDQLKEVVRARLEQRAAVRQQVVMRQQIAKHLMEQVDFELPQGLTADQARRSFERRRMELMYRGVPADEIEAHVAELRAQSGATAVRDLKLFFLLNKAGDELEVGVDEADVNTRIAQMAMQQGVRPEKLRKQIIESGRVGAIVQQVREHKAMDAILGKAEIEDVSAEDFAKRMSDLSEAAGELAEDA